MQEQVNNLIKVQSNLKFKLTTESIPIRIKGSDENAVQMIFLDEHNNNIPFEKITGIVNYSYDDTDNIFNLKISDENIEFERIYLNLKIPRKTEFTINSENSPIQMKYLEGFQQIHSENGPITAKEINGNLKFQTENGPINLKKCAGNFILKSENAPINIEDCSGENFQLETENGPIRLRKLSGNLILKSENASINLEESTGKNFKIETENGGIKSKKNSFLSGNIKCENGRILFDTSKTEEGDFSLKSSNGKIIILVNKDKNINLDAQTEYGSLNIDLDGKIFRSSTDGLKQIKVEQENAKINIVAKNENGSISTNENTDFSFDPNNLKNSLNGYLKMFQNLMGNEHLKEFVNAFSSKDHKKKEEMKEKTKEKVSKIIVKVKDEIEKNLPKKKIIIDGKDIGELIKDKLDKVTEKMEKKADEEKTTEETNQTEDFAEAKVKILQMLDEKKITVEQALKLLDALK